MDQKVIFMNRWGQLLNSSFSVKGYSPIWLKLCLITQSKRIFGWYYSLSPNFGDIFRNGSLKTTQSTGSGVFLSSAKFNIMLILKKSAFFLPQTLQFTINFQLYRLLNLSIFLLIDFLRGFKFERFCFSSLICFAVTFPAFLSENLCSNLLVKQSIWSV